MTQPYTKTNQGPPPAIADILARVSTSSGYTEAQLCGRAQSPDLVASRYLVWWLCSQAGYSSNQIGTALGYEGSTIRAAFRRLKRDLAPLFPSDPIFTRSVLGQFAAGLATPASQEEPKAVEVTKPHNPQLRGDTTPPRRSVSLASGNAQTGSPNLVT